MTARIKLLKYFEICDIWSILCVIHSVGHQEHEKITPSCSSTEHSRRISMLCLVLIKSWKCGRVCGIHGGVIRDWCGQYHLSADSLRLRRLLNQRWPQAAVQPQRSTSDASTPCGGRGRMGSPSLTSHASSPYGN